MAKKKFFLIYIAVAVLLIASFSIATVSAFPDNIVREKTFVTYITGDPLGTPRTDSYNIYAYDGIHWATGKVVTYSVNTKTAPTGTITAVKAAFETWDAQINNKLFDDNVNVAAQNLAGNRYDGKNVVSWGRLGKGIIAQTTVWYNQKLEIVEFGMVFSTAYKWGIDKDGEGTTYALTGAFDVQNIATHEAGHTLMLEDLYMQEANALTMYGYGDYGQTYARSLGTGDINGIHAIYPTT